MKKCPFCAEDIQDAAVKCRYCGEFLEGRRDLPAEKPKLYFRVSFIVLAVCSVGPLALPLIWWRPHTSRSVKIGWTLAILVLTWVLYEAMIESLRMLNDLGFNGLF